jgi:hypothetical protein
MSKVVHSVGRNQGHFIEEGLMDEDIASSLLSFPTKV